MHTLVSLFIGALVGWIAGKIMHSKGGLIRNIVLGLLGGALGGWLGSLIGVEPASWISLQHPHRHRRLLPPHLAHAQAVQVTRFPLPLYGLPHTLRQSFFVPRPVFDPAALFFAPVHGKILY